MSWKLLFAAVLAVICLTQTTNAEDELKHLLYVTSRDGAGGKGGKGIYVYDMDNDHKLVRFIEMPQLGGTRGSCACAATDRMCISHSNDRLLCLDLKTDKVVWEQQYSKEDGGADRIGVTPDGKNSTCPVDGGAVIDTSGSSTPTRAKH